MIRRQIGLSPEINTESEVGWGVVPRWDTLGEGSIIFPRIETP